MNEIILKPIGIIHTPFKEPGGIPIQPDAGQGIRGVVEVFNEFEAGLKDIEGFSHIILIYYFHLSKKFKLLSKPYMDDTERGVFAIRGPSRPNCIGISTVKLIKRENNVLFIEDLDIVDDSPLLDIKPYVPQFDVRENVKIGWLEKKVHKLHETRDDGRFAK
ncbi:tRNA (N6-threonylcarbamoyladenosine(37)-N6)-methyltransferase TrmO [candidate division WOR-3 bacterium]|jgi:tRNA-Thr(GGU) m(6)t(6)A37 methyltransferase TsaA|nr:tRNA (N6-threonylcarbamoyladenosine(37)-N6)-methyltransferase TrmO [candidate division WOR-3 bacterium]